MTTVPCLATTFCQSGIVANSELLELLDKRVPKYDDEVEEEMANPMWRRGRLALTHMMSYVPVIHSMEDAAYPRTSLELLSPYNDKLW